MFPSLPLPSVPPSKDLSSPTLEGGLAKIPCTCTPGEDSLLCNTCFLRNGLEILASQGVSAAKSYKERHQPQKTNAGTGWAKVVEFMANAEWNSNYEPMVDWKAVWRELQREHGINYKDETFEDSLNNAMACLNVSHAREAKAKIDLPIRSQSQVSDDKAGPRTKSNIDQVLRASAKSFVPSSTPTTRQKPQNRKKQQNRKKSKKKNRRTQHPVNHQTVTQIHSRAQEQAVKYVNEKHPDRPQQQKVAADNVINSKQQHASNNNRHNHQPRNASNQPYQPLNPPSFNLNNANDSFYLASVDELDTSHYNLSPNSQLVPRPIPVAINNGTNKESAGADGKPTGIKKCGCDWSQVCHECHKDPEYEFDVYAGLS